MTDLFEVIVKREYDAFIIESCIFANRMIYDYYITYYAISKREYRDLFEMAKEAGYLKSAGKNGNPTLEALGKD